MFVNDPNGNTNNIVLPAANVAGKVILININNYSLDSGLLRILPQGADVLIVNQFTLLSSGNPQNLDIGYWGEFVSDGNGHWYRLGAH